MLNNLRWYLLTQAEFMTALLCSVVDAGIRII